MRSTNSKFLLVMGLIAASSLLSGCYVSTMGPDGGIKERYVAPWSGLKTFDSGLITIEGRLELLGGNNRVRLLKELDGGIATIHYSIGKKQGTVDVNISGANISGTLPLEKFRIPSAQLTNSDVKLSLVTKAGTFEGKDIYIKEDSLDIGDKELSATVKVKFVINSVDKSKAILNELLGIANAVNPPSDAPARRISGRAAKSPDEGEWSAGEVVDTHKAGIPK
jgi:hypothetical protein